LSSANRPKERRVVITGIGVLSPAGSGLEDYWRGITCGRSAIREVKLFDASHMPVRSAGEVDQATLASAVPENVLKRTDRAVVLGLVAADRALADADVLQAAQDGLPVGVLIGSGIGPCHDAGQAYGIFGSRGWKGIRPTTIPRLMFNRIASEISIKYHLTGGHHVVVAACSSSSLAMVEAYDAVRCGREDVVLTGGCDSPLTPSIYGAWMNLRILSKNPDPARASRPFDANRDGLVLAEGAAMLVFEEAERARRRGAHAYAEVVGYGTSSDATHITNPSVEGQAKALCGALRCAGVSPEEVDYINAHGTSTVLNDRSETQAIKLAFPGCAKDIPISSTKSVIGHTMGASGAMGLVAILLAIRHQTIPPTVNLDDPDPECDLDYVPYTARPGRIRVALSNSFGFGGANAVIAVRAIEES